MIRYLRNDPGSLGYLLIVAIFVGVMGPALA